MPIFAVVHAAMLEAGFVPLQQLQLQQQQQQQQQSVPTAMPSVPVNAPVLPECHRSGGVYSVSYQFPALPAVVCVVCAVPMANTVARTLFPPQNSVLKPLCYWEYQHLLPFICGPSSTAVTVYTCVAALAILEL
jgi:hypothetical protein